MNKSILSFGGLLLAAGMSAYIGKKATDTKMTPPAVPKEAAVSLQRVISVQSQPSEAVILFIGPENQDERDSLGGQQFRSDYCAHVAERVEKLQEGFERNGVPCYIIGDPFFGFTMKQAQKDIVRLINRYDYHAVTGIVMCHGGIKGYKNPTECTVEEIEERLSSDTVYHNVQISYNGKGKEKTNYTNISIGDFFGGLSEDSLKKAGAKHGLIKMDNVVGTCYSGSTKQKDADRLPKGSTVVAISAPNEESRKITCLSFAQGADSTKGKYGIDGLDLGRMMLYHSSQVGENDAVIYVSGEKEKISLNKQAAIFYRNNKPSVFLAANEKFIATRLFDYKSRVAKDFYSMREYNLERSYEEYFKNHRPILQGFALDKTIIFAGEPGRPKKYRGYGIK